MGRDPAVHVWDAVKMETLAILKGQHERGVCAVDFSGTLFSVIMLQTRMGWCERTLNGNDLNGHEHFERTEHNSINTKYFLLWA